MSFTAEQIFNEIDKLSPQEKNNLVILLDEKEQEELLYRMSLPRNEDITEEELFNQL